MPGDCVDIGSSLCGVATYSELIPVPGCPGAWYRDICPLHFWDCLCCADTYWPGCALYRANVVCSEVVYEEWRVVRSTPKGVWVVPANWYDPELDRKDYAGDARWTTRNGRLCSPTHEAAKRHLVARTRSWARKAAESLRRAQDRCRVLGIDPNPPNRRGALRFGSGRAWSHV